MTFSYLSLRASIASVVISYFTGCDCFGTPFLAMTGLVKGLLHPPNSVAGFAMTFSYLSLRASIASVVISYFTGCDCFGIPSLAMTGLGMRLLHPPNSWRDSQ